MGFSKHRVLVGLIVFQTVVILFLIHQAISIRNEEIFARTEASYYRKALEEVSQMEEEALFNGILQERENLLREYESILEITRRHRLKIGRSAPPRAAATEQPL